MSGLRIKLVRSPIGLVCFRCGVRKGVGMSNIWFWLSVVALVVGIAYILVAHPVLLGAIAVVLISVALCVVSWVLGGQG